MPSQSAICQDGTAKGIWILLTPSKQLQDFILKALTRRSSPHALAISSLLQDDVVLTELFALADCHEEEKSVVFGLVYAMLSINWDRKSTPGYYDYLNLMRVCCPQIAWFLQ
eukprot:g30780.t1